MALEQRLRQIEQRLEQAGVRKEPITLFVVYEPNKPSAEQLEKAKAEYRAKNPDYLEKDFNVVYVEDGHSGGR